MTDLKFQKAFQDGSICQKCDYSGTLSRSIAPTEERAETTERKILKVMT